MAAQMRIALGQFNQLTDEKLQFAKQLGVSGVQMNLLGHSSLPGEQQWEYEDLLALRLKTEEYGLKFEAIENVPLHFYDKALLGLPGRDEQIAHYTNTIRNMGRAGIPVLGYHFMPNSVWRTSRTAPGRGGAAERVHEARAQRGRAAHRHLLAEDRAHRHLEPVERAGNAQPRPCRHDRGKDRIGAEHLRHPRGIDVEVQKLAAALDHEREIAQVVELQAEMDRASGQRLQLGKEPAGLPVAEGEKENIRRLELRAGAKSQVGATTQMGMDGCGGPAPQPLGGDLGHLDPRMAEKQPQQLAAGVLRAEERRDRAVCRHDSYRTISGIRDVKVAVAVHGDEDAGGLAARGEDDVGNVAGRDAGVGELALEHGTDLLGEGAGDAVAVMVSGAVFRRGLDLSATLEDTKKGRSRGCRGLPGRAG